MFKETTESLFEKLPAGSYLNNLGERRELLYKDNAMPMKREDLDKMIKEVAEYYKEEWGKYKFAPNDTDELHFFLYLPNEWKEKLGNTRICVCPYKGYQYGPLVSSNYMWSKFDDVATLFIDIYNCNECDKEYIFTFVLQELYNFMRDTKWVLDGVYEDEMQKMEEELLSMDFNVSFDDIIKDNDEE